MRKRLLASALLFALPSIGSAGQLTYTPVNPVFGGNPANGTYLLGLAAANNSKFLTAKTQSSPASTNQDAVQQFQQVVTSALLSQIASQVGQEIIGPNAANSGTFNLNGEVIQFARSGGQVNINITDGASGATTNIQIPVPQF
jgi:curli production assembly/transport component CsgF